MVYCADGEEMKNPLGIMQGRLLPPINNRIQAFSAENWQEEFAIAKELSLDCIEFIFEGEEYNKHPLMNEKGIREIENVNAKTGVKILSVCADYFMDNTLHKNNNTENNVLVLKQLITNCAMLDVKDIVIPCVDQSKIVNDDELNKFVNSLKTCIPLAGEKKINLNLETDLPPQQLLNLLKKFSSDIIKVNYDIGNSAALGYNPVEEINTYGKYISDVHIKDRMLGGGTVPLGEGNANFSAVFQKLLEIKFKGIFILQTARKELGQEAKTIGEYLQFIKRYLDF